jgi:Putative 2OG-Fe(II) oxygenase
MKSGHETIHAIDIARVCVWSADLAGLNEHQAAFEADIEDLLARGERNFAAYGEQTRTVLHQLTAPHWKLLFSRVRGVMSSVVQDSAIELDEGRVHLRAWASRMRQQGQYCERQTRLNALHSHWPAFLSAIYYLRIPPDLEEADGGTLFVNPFPNSLAQPDPGTVVSPAEGRLVVFPSWLIHSPFVLDYSNVSSPRIVIGIDAHFIPE